MRRIGSLLAIAALLTAIFVAPSAYSANEIPVKFAATDLPKDLTINRAWAEIDSGYSQICLDTSYLGSETSMVMTDVSVLAPTEPVIKVSPSRNFIYFNQARSCAILDAGDLWGNAKEITISAKLRVGNYTYFASENFSPVVKKLEALGIKVKESYVAFSVDKLGTSFSVYIDFETTALDGSSLIGRTFKVREAVVTSKERAAIPLTRTDPYFKITEGTLVLGSTRQEIDLNLTSHLIDAAFEWVEPLSLTSKVNTSLPLSFSLESDGSYYDRSRDESTVGIAISGDVVRDSFVDFSKLRLSGTKLSKSVAAYGSKEAKIYLPIKKDLTTTAGESKGFLSFIIPGHFYDAGSLSLTGPVSEVPISVADFSKVKLPKGISLRPTYGYNFYYDSTRKVTDVYASFTSTMGDSFTLERKKTAVTSGKVDNTISPLFAPYAYDEEQKNFEYSAYFGSIKGDARSGRKVKVTGDLRLHPRTKVTSLIGGDTSSEEIYFNEFSLRQPEAWRYISKKKMTAPRFVFENWKKSKVTIYGCDIQATLDGKVHKLENGTFELTGKESYQYFDRPFIPGDVRYGSKPIDISGSFQLTPCS